MGEKPGKPSPKYVFIFGGGSGIDKWLMLFVGLLFGLSMILLFKQGPGITGSAVMVDAIERPCPAAQPAAPPALPQPSSAAVFPAVLKLREAHKRSDLVATAQLVNALQESIPSSQEALSASWEAVTLCLATRCPDETFLEFIRAAAWESAKAQRWPGKLVLDLLVARKYWGTDNIVRFAQAVAAVDEEVSARGGALPADWKAIVACDGTCANESARYFMFLDHLVLA